MNNTIAIFFNPNIDLGSVCDYANKKYDDIFYIIDSITIPNNTKYPVIHYTDIRMKQIDVLVTQASDIEKVYGFSNRIILYYQQTPTLINKNYLNYIDKINSLHAIWHDNTVPVELLIDIFQFKKEIIHV